MDFTVRKATAQDIDTLVHFNMTMAKETENKTLSADVLSVGVRALLDDPAKGFYIVAELDDETAGCLMITTEWSDWRNGYFWWIQSVYVDRNHRGRGVYRTLHQWVEREAKRLDVRGLRLYVDRENHGAKRVYEKMRMVASPYDLYESEGSPAAERSRG